MKYNFKRKERDKINGLFDSIIKYYYNIKKQTFIKSNSEDICNYNDIFFIVFYILFKIKICTRTFYFSLILSSFSGAHIKNNC